MTENEQNLLSSIWALSVRQGELLKQILPLLSELLTVIDSGQKPTDEQIHAWTTLAAQVTNTVYEVSAAMESLGRMVFSETHSASN